MKNLDQLKPGQTRTDVVKLTDKKIVTTIVEKRLNGRVFMQTKQRMLHRRNKNERNNW